MPEFLFATLIYKLNQPPIFKLYPIALLKAFITKILIVINLQLFFSNQI